jgi:hypothetical protein
MIKKENPAEQVALMFSRFYYDLQALRIASGNRTNKGLEGIHLTEKQQEFLTSISVDMKALERQANNAVAACLKGIPIWEKWLKDQKGIGPTLGAFLIGEINIEKCTTVSKLWAWLGLSVDKAECPVCAGNGVLDDHDPDTREPIVCKNCNGDGIVGQSQRLRKGQKAKYDPRRKAKVLHVLGTSLIKASPLYKKPKDPETGKVTEDESLWEELPPTKWRKLYDDYKHRKTNQVVPVCMGCLGTGKRNVGKNKFGEVKDVDMIPKEHLDPDAKTVEKPCWNCDGTGVDAPWGRDNKHRHAAAVRYMVKQFLLELHTQWRLLEGLPVRKPYAEEYLGRTHNAA